MIDLTTYEEYWDTIKERIPEIKTLLPITVDADIGPTIQSLGLNELPILFIFVPTAIGDSRNADNVHENNMGVVFIMDKYDNQRKKAYQILKEIQPLIEQLKSIMIDDSACSCHFLANLDLKSLSTIPETGFYKDMAGWSLGFKFKT